MRRRTPWKEYAAAVGDAAMDRRALADYAQTASALEHWVREGSGSSSGGYHSPWIGWMTYGAHIDDDSAPEPPSSSFTDAVGAAVASLPEEFRWALLAHYANLAKLGNQLFHMPPQATIRERCRRWLNLRVEDYYHQLKVAHHQVARKLGLDGL